MVTGKSAPAGIFSFRRYSKPFGRCLRIYACEFDRSSIGGRGARGAGSRKRARFAAGARGKSRHHAVGAVCHESNRAISQGKVPSSIM